LNIIPVIDLLNGQVVHAKHGDRQNYLPIQSKLCASSQPHIVLDALLELYPFDCLYIADLNAIQQNGHHFDLIKSLQKSHPSIDFWLDAGFDHPQTIRETSCSVVLGSESLLSMAHYNELMGGCARSPILSLDFKSGLFHGPSELIETANDWPQRIITMTLNKVGSSSGPDMAQLQAIQSIADGRQIYAAGGVRDSNDLLMLKQMQCSGALVASALHAGSLSGLQLGQIIKG